MIELNAFFYEDDYYLFPDNVTDVSGMIRFLRNNGGQAEVRRLSPRGCYPPWFTHNSLEPGELKTIDERFVFPATVYLMDRDEYARRLRERVNTQCRYCHRFSGDVISLRDYYEEVPLCEKCTDRLSKEEFNASGSLRTGYEPYFSVDDFWNDFMRAAPVLKRLMDSGRLSEATRRISELLNNAGFSEYLFPALSRFSYINAHNEPVVRYVLMLSGAGFLCADMVASYFANLVPEKLREDWDVYPYIIRGLYTYWPGVTELDVAASPPMLRATYLEQQDCFQVYVFADWDREKVLKLMPPDTVLPDDYSDEDVPGIVFCANYLYLSSIIGEDRLRGACLELVMFPASELVYDGNTVTPEEFDRLIELKIRDKTKLLPENNTKRLDLEGVAELRNVSSVHTRADQLSFDLLLGGDNASGYMWDRDIAIGTLKLEWVPDPDYIEFFKTRLTRTLENTGAAQLFDICTGEDGVFFDLLVWDKFETRRFMHSLAPALRPFGARFTLKLCEETEEFEV